jgi:hypothetical protein
MGLKVAVVVEVALEHLPSYLLLALHSSWVADPLATCPVVHTMSKLVAYHKIAYISLQGQLNVDLTEEQLLIMNKHFF